MPCYTNSLYLSDVNMNIIQNGEYSWSNPASLIAAFTPGIALVVEYKQLSALSQKIAALEVPLSDPSLQPLRNKVDHVAAWHRNTSILRAITSLTLAVLSLSWFPPAAALLALWACVELYQCDVSTHVHSYKEINNQTTLVNPWTKPVRRTVKFLSRWY